MMKVSTFDNPTYTFTKPVPHGKCEHYLDLLNFPKLLMPSREARKENSSQGGDLLGCLELGNFLVCI